MRGFGLWREPPGGARSRLSPLRVAHARAPPPVCRARWVGWESGRGRGYLRVSGDLGAEVRGHVGSVCCKELGDRREAGGQEFKRLVFWLVWVL